ncbi:MAG TPA: tetratricopeptide repeat protein [Phycisphaerales bacterium]|nr:tetratricopeptide repeat protein [Phycisphaerales bacterium]
MAYGSARTIRVVVATAVLACGSVRSFASAQPQGEQSYRAGIGLLNKGLSDLASAEFRRYLEEHPDGAQATNARYSLGICLTRLGKHAEALPYLKLAAGVEGFEFAADAKLLLAQCHLAGGEQGGAVDVLRGVLKEHPQFKQLDVATALLGETLYRTGEHAEAAEVLAQVSRQWPGSAVRERAELFATMAESAGGQSKAAADRAAKLRAAFPKGEYGLHAALVEARCRQQLGELGAALKLYEAAAGAKDQVRVEALIGLASVARSQGDLARAEASLADAEKAGVPAGLRDWWTLERGKLLYSKGDAAGAARVFREARGAADVSVQAEAAFWAAKCQAKQGKHAEAAANFEGAAERYPKSVLVPEMLFERAAALSMAGEGVAALEAWGEWRGRFGSHALAAEALVAHAWAAHRAGELDESERLIGELASRHAERRASETVQLLVAENAFARGDHEGALRAYGELVRAHPKSAHVWRGAARRVLSLVQLERGAEAAAELTKALADGEGQDAGLRRAAVGAVADHLFAKSDWKGAEAWFARLAAESGDASDKLEAALRQAICVERQGRFAEAVPLLDRVIAEDGSSEQGQRARFERGQCLLQLGKLDEARQAFEAVREGGAPEPLKEHAARHLATIASKQGRHEDAAELLSGLDGGAADGTGLALGSAYLAAGKYQEALRALSGVAEVGSTDAVKARALRAIALNRLGQHEEAAEALGASVKDAALDAETKASARYELALALRSLSRENESVEVLRALEKDGPARLACYARLDLAQVEAQAGRFDEAVALLDRCLGAAASLGAADAAVISERATYLRGSCLLRGGKPKQAADALASFAKSYPNSALLGHARLVRGEALLGSGLGREAAEELALGAACENTEVRASAQLRLGDAWAACQEWVKSEQAFTAFLDRASDSPLWYQARFGQGWARENQGRHESALEAYRDVVARHDGPTAARAQFQIGECLYAQKKHDAAVAEFLKADVLYAYPEWSAAALYEAGRCLEESGRGDDAARQYEDLITRFPESKWAKLAQERAKAAAKAGAPAPVPGRGSPTAAAPGDVSRGR